MIFFKRKRKSSKITGLFVLKIKDSLFLLEKREKELKKKDRMC